MNYCGIFFISLEGSEATSKIFGDISPQGKISNHYYMSIFWDIPKWLLWVRQKNRQATVWPVSSYTDCGMPTNLPKNLWLPQSTYLAAKEGYLPESQNGFAHYAKVWSACPDPPLPEIPTNGRTTAQIPQFAGQTVHCPAPNQKWVTDISYIHTGQGVLYLSIIRDLFDNSIVSYKTGTEQTVNLVLDTIRVAKRKENVTAELQLHSDQGFQYTSQAYFCLTQRYGITPSMSRRGNCYDNAMAENFFSCLKTECIYRQKILTFQQARELIDEYICFYNHQRIQLKTKLAPLEKRHQFVA